MQLANEYMNISCFLVPKGYMSVSVRTPYNLFCDAAYVISTRAPISTQCAKAYMENNVVHCFIAERSRMCQDMVCCDPASFRGAEGDEESICLCGRGGGLFLLGETF